MIAAMFLPVAILCAALTVDLAMLALERKKIRAAADLAAIVAAQNLQSYEAAARGILELNGYDTVTKIEYGRMDEEEKAVAATEKSMVKVEPGRYERDVARPVDERFVAGGAPYNAVRVSVSKVGHTFFAGAAFKPPFINAIAIASAQEIAAFSVGSRLASLREGLANKILSGLVGSEVSLSVLDYNALLDADIEVFRFLDVLAADLHLTSGRYDDVLESQPTLGEALDVLAHVSADEGNGAASQALLSLARSASSPAQKIKLARVIDLGPFGDIAIGAADTQGMPVRAGVMDILFANAVVANGDTFIHLDLSASVPSLASVTAALSIGERMQNSPWLRIGQDAEVVSNVQLRLQVVATLLGKGLLKDISIKAPLYLELARAEARLSDVRCRAGDAEVDILARPGVADIWLGEADLEKRVTRQTQVDRAQIVKAPAIKAYARARATIDNVAETPLTFTHNDIAAGRIKSTSTEDILESLLRSLAKDIEIDLNIGGLSLGSGPLLRGALSESLGDVLAMLDEPIAELLAALGVRIGEADIRVNGVRCDRSVLVQ